MKKILVFLIIFTVFLLPSCSSLPDSPPVEPINVELPPKPQDYSTVLEKIREELGPAPNPTIIIQGNVTYFGFTKEQMVQLRLFNEAYRQLEEIILSQHKQANIYFMSLETLKARAEAGNAQAKKYRELYEAAKSEVKRKELEALGYKILTFGSIIAIIALAF